MESERRRLEARVSEIEKQARVAATTELQNIESKLGELRELLAQGWDELSQTTVAKLHGWLDQLEQLRSGQSPHSRRGGDPW